jgi:hypothetical protein
VNTATKTDPAATPAPLDFTKCPDWGKGGQYIYDPATGLRTRLAPAEEPVGQPAQTGAGAGQAVAPGEDTVTDVAVHTHTQLKKEKQRA